MPLHFSFVFGMGSYFNFSFTIGHPPASTTTTEKIESDEPILRRRAKLPASRGSAMPHEVSVDRHDHGLMPLPSRDMLGGPSLGNHAHGTTIPNLDFLDTPYSDTINSLETEIKSIRAATRPKSMQRLPVDNRVGSTQRSS